MDLIGTHTEQGWGVMFTECLSLLALTYPSRRAGMGPFLGTQEYDFQLIQHSLGLCFPNSLWQNVKCPSRHWYVYRCLGRNSVLGAGMLMGGDRTRPRGRGSRIKRSLGGHCLEMLPLTTCIIF